ncbi:MAG: MATE family efflux transporter [Lachnobacterium sp.]|nr:MATE family efflux transporter [Lachnobacterium sp.]
MKASSNLTEGPIFKTMMLFAFPMILGNLLQQIYNIVDTIIVGRFVSSEALAAVGSAYALMTFINSLIIGLCMGSGALFSKSFGAGKQADMRQEVKLSFVFIGIITAIIYIIVFPGTDLILRLLAVPADVYALMRSYVRIIFAGIVFIFLFNFFAYLLRAVGNSLVPLIFLAISSVTNIVLDLYFVISLKWGVAGAAGATIISQALAGVGIAIYVMARHRDLVSSGKDGRTEWYRLGEIIKNDVFTGLQQSVMNFGILMIQGLVNSFGTTIMAAFAAAVKIDTLAYMPAQEYANAYSLFISQNYGARKQERIAKGTRIATAVSVIFCLVVSVIIWIFSRDFMEIFVEASETAIIAAGVKYLRIEGSFYFGIGILFLLYGYYRGVQRAEMSLVLTVISLGTRVALSYMLAPHTALGVNAIWWSIPIGWILADVVGGVYYKKLTK